MKEVLLVLLQASYRPHVLYMLIYNCPFIWHGQCVFLKSLDICLLGVTLQWLQFLLVAEKGPEIFVGCHVLFIVLAAASFIGLVIAS